MYRRKNLLKVNIHHYRNYENINRRCLININLFRENTICGNKNLISISQNKNPRTFWRYLIFIHNHIIRKKVWQKCRSQRKINSKTKKSKYKNYQRNKNKLSKEIPQMISRSKKKNEIIS